MRVWIYKLKTTDGMEYAAEQDHQITQDEIDEWMDHVAAEFDSLEEIGV